MTKTRKILRQVTEAYLHSLRELRPRKGLNDTEGISLHEMVRCARIGRSIVYSVNRIRDLESGILKLKKLLGVRK